MKLKIGDNIEINIFKSNEIIRPRYHYDECSNTGVITTFGESICIEDEELSQKIIQSWIDKYNDKKNVNIKIICAL